MSLQPNVFSNRADAGRQLAQKLTRFRDRQPVVLALPRGGVPVGFEVARFLDAPLDVALARKVGAPFQPELGVGAVAPEGILLLDEPLLAALHIPQTAIQPVVSREQQELERQSHLFRGDRPPTPLAGKTCILVDDGLATGVTARAVIRWLRTKSPLEIVLAVPVCANETANAMMAEVDEMICVLSPLDFRAVGFWYEDFSQTTDEEVITLLDRAARRFETPQGREDK